MLVAEKAVGLSWVSVRDRLPFDGHECALICRNLDSNKLRRAIGGRLHGNWEIQDGALVKYDVCAWLKLLSTPSNISNGLALWSDSQLPLHVALRNGMFRSAHREQRQRKAGSPVRPCARVPHRQKL